MNAWDRRRKADALTALIQAGALMANHCFNLKQDRNLPAPLREAFERNQKNWDAALKTYRELTTPKPKKEPAP